MVPRCCLVALVALLASVSAFRAPVSGRRWVSKTALNDVPLELTGRLDPAKTWDVTLEFEGQTKVVTISEGTSVLDCAEKAFGDAIESSCRNGVCTTCAGQVVKDRQNTLQAVNCLGKPQLDAGFVCTCQTYVCGAGVTVKLGQYDAVYETQVRASGGGGGGFVAEGCLGDCKRWVLRYLAVWLPPSIPLLTLPTCTHQRSFCLFCSFPSPPSCLPILFNFAVWSIRKELCKEVMFYGNGN